MFNLFVSGSYRNARHQCDDENYHKYPYNYFFHICLHASFYRNEKRMHLWSRQMKRAVIVHLADP